MTVFYAQDTECWEDTDDFDFKIPMTPESISEDQKEFSSQEEFLNWYEKGENEK
jgi:hypothetical protein